MNITLAIKFTKEVLSLEDSYRHAWAWIARLAEADASFQDWWASPRGPKDQFLPFGNEAELLARQAEEAENFPGLKVHGAPALLLTNAGDETSWRRRGGVALTINPSFGEMRLDIGRIEKVYDAPDALLWRVLKGAASDQRVTFAQTDVQQRVQDELLLYSISRAVFPHREFFGWMGYIPQQLTAEQVPDAARLEVVGNGTCILATDTLDLSQPTSIQQANKVEMSLADLNLLAITDPSLR